MLLIGGKMDFETGKVTDIAQAVPTNCMECILAVLRAARPQAYADLLMKACALAANQDPLHVMSTHMTMKVIPKVLAATLIGGNFATRPVTSLLNEANSVEPSLFMPQRCVEKVNTVKQSELIISNKLMMGVPAAQRTMQKMATARIGANKSADYFISICVNINTFIMATVDKENGPIPILLQLVMELVRMVSSPDWKNWFELTGSRMPNIHIALYGTWNLSGTVKQNFPLTS